MRERIGAAGRRNGLPVFKCVFLGSPSFRGGVFGFPCFEERGGRGRVRRCSSFGPALGTFRLSGTRQGAGKMLSPLPATLAARAHLELHKKATCTAQNCPECLWLRLRRGWRTRFAWCAAGYANGKFGIGCVLCAHATTKYTPHRGSGRSFAQFEITAATGSHLWRHARTKQHRAAMMMEPAGPTAEEMEACWKKLQEGGSARDYGQASDCKSLMRWCLSEAVLERLRGFLRKAKSIVLCRDEREGRLLVRFRAATRDMRCKTGVLGLAKGYGPQSGENIVHATRDLLRTFCTPLANPPRGTRLRPTVDEDLVAHIRDHIEIMVTDAAGNELLAANLGRGRREMHVPVRKKNELLSPNLILVARDHAHASRRTGVGVTVQCGRRPLEPVF